ncbi:hypothetical protein [Actomonas aquatica]|uniref:Uncharacterized protein n=1 Tax=Actomonas aquatica TaxID=2866162 RepID=A0ABZ1CDS1_9BACT|nr:hypothetical protein [Opitutus sp. WL0086]WRQ89437.1 hypothetical protein K1X11_008450 [Opitutus sp. WL0086]
MRNWASYWSLPERVLPGRAAFDFKAHVVYFDPDWRLLWLHDGTVAGYVKDDWDSMNVEPGNYYHITGEIQLPAAELSLRDAVITALPPEPLPALKVDDLTDHQRFRDQFVEIEGLVESQSRADAQHLQLNLAAHGRRFSAWVLAPSDGESIFWTGSFVRLSGIYNARVTPADEFVSLEVMVGRESQVQFLSHLADAPRFEIPASPINSLTEAAPDQPVRIVGELVQQVPGQFVTVRGETGEAQVFTGQMTPLPLHTRVEAWGYPRAQSMQVELTQAFVRPAVAAPETVPPNGPVRQFTLSRRVLGLAPEVANEKLPVELDGVITWSHPESPFLYLQDTSGGIGVYVGSNHPEIPKFGTRVTLRGTTGLGDFAPVVIANSFTETGTIELPTARPITLDAAATGIYEAQWVSLTGYLHRVVPGANRTLLDLSTIAGDFRAVLPETFDFTDQEGAIVTVEGVCTALTDERGRVTSIRLWVPSREQLRIEIPFPENPFALPLVPLADFGRFGTVEYYRRHVRVTGTVLASTRDRVVLIQQGPSTLRLLRRDDHPLRAGDRVDAVGLPTRSDQSFALREAQIRVVGPGNPPAPHDLPNPRILHPEWEDRLVAVEAELLELAIVDSRPHLTLRSQDIVFEAQDRGLDPIDPDELRTGSRLRLSGIYHLQRNSLGDPESFNLHIDGARSVDVLSLPSAGPPHRSLYVGGFLVLMNAITLIWALRLRRHLHALT